MLRKRPLGCCSPGQGAAICASTPLASASRLGWAARDAVAATGLDPPPARTATSRESGPWRTISRVSSSVSGTPIISRVGQSRLVGHDRAGAEAGGDTTWASEVIALIR